MKYEVEVESKFRVEVEQRRLSFMSETIFNYRKLIVWQKARELMKLKRKSDEFGVKFIVNELRIALRMNYMV